MKERPILMTTESVKAILDGRKTMTRRTAGLSWVNKNPDDWRIDTTHNGNGFFVRFILYQGSQALHTVKCPYGQVGDRLYIKETWAVPSFSANFAETSQLQIAYRAGRTIENPHPDGMTHSLEWRTVDYETWQKYACQKYYSWQPSLFMPKAFARIWLPITGLRTERLQEITEEDAKAEGLTPLYKTAHHITGAGYTWDNEGYRRAFQQLWDSLNAKRGYPFDFNPWVWPIKFDNIGIRNK